MPQTVLVINSGSSSLKYQLIDPDTGHSVAQGLAERIGEDVGHLHHRYSVREVDITEPIPTHADAMKMILDLFEEVGPPLEEANIVAVGHRIVQGGRYFNGPALVDDRVIRLIDELSTLAPLHNPPALVGIKVAQELLPQIPQVAVFDTAFFQDLPPESALYALDRDIAERYSIRRYGAHGTSHRFVSKRVSEILGGRDLKQIVLHLGNGASASAIVGDHAVDTSMGMTPLEGLVMGTRTGDIDPAVTFYLQRVAGMSVDDVDELMNRRSGLKGLTGDNDMRQVRDIARSGDHSARKRAREALKAVLSPAAVPETAAAAAMGRPRLRKV